MLKELEGFGVVASRRWPSGPRRYDPNTDEHVDVRCMRCGVIEEVVEPPFIGDSYRHLVAHNSGMRNVAVRAVGEGICRACSGSADDGRGENL